MTASVVSARRTHRTTYDKVPFSGAWANSNRQSIRPLHSSPYPALRNCSRDRGYATISALRGSEPRPCPVSNPVLSPMHMRPPSMRPHPRMSPANQ
ncbi:hypothetical protein GGTG_04870 [Gaeumannomyces tritici R3-111a-1]|uniref:Uncharacterized protein n=1 Tax=Gaeumannomyces tritici (strain R3-111a-1) TaxID=644352 RepID=J3NUB6_GAET3|nr:hypothetical protein GGTG_04870 [Gaeumannomyces tritici R3-111a-1]EJT79787.1 hypothetical protein GGTG_04870 [Gaeumannomyces tritici R3-111a-1]